MCVCGRGVGGGGGGRAGLVGRTRERTIIKPMPSLLGSGVFLLLLLRSCILLLPTFAVTQVREYGRGPGYFGILNFRDFEESSVFKCHYYIISVTPITLLVLKIRFVLIFAQL